LIRGRFPKAAAAALFLAVTVSVGYLAGQRGIPVEDGGEFLTVARLGGVDHPPGLPLVSFLARVSWVFLGRSCLRALFAVLSGLLLLLLAERRGLPRVLFAAGVLLLPGVSGRLLMWDAYCPLLVLYAAALLRRPAPDLEGGFLLGLALAVHPMGAFIPLLYRRKGIRPFAFAAGTVMGLGLYLALPLGSAGGVPVDWGGADSWSRFARQVSAAGYREVYGDGMGGFSGGVLANHLDALRGMLWPVLLPMAAAGVWRCVSEGGRRILAALLLLAVMDALFVLLVNPMASGTTQTGILTLFTLLALAFMGFGLVEEKAGRRAAAALGTVVLAAGVFLWEPLPDQEEEVRAFYGNAPPDAGIFVTDNDILYGGWVLKYVDDRRPDLAILSTGNFSPWIERLAVAFNPDLDLSRGLEDVGGAGIGREEAVARLVAATVEDNPQRRFFVGP